jgi:hypothetical protein
MAQVCGKCKAYDAEGAVTTCPTCNLPMQFTLLPPPSQGAAPLSLPVDEPRPGPRRPVAAEQGHIMDLLGSLFRYRLLAYLVLLPLLSAGGFFGVQSVVGDGQKSQSDPFQIRTKFDDVQNRMQQPAPTPGFEPAANTSMTPIAPPQQPVINSSNTIPTRTPQPPAMPKMNGRNPGRP